MVLVVAFTASVMVAIGVRARLATADPIGSNTAVGVGSNTVQDLFDAYGGLSNGVAYAPLLSSATTGNKSISSWDATPAGTCIAPSAKLGGSSFDRPNGTSDGIAALGDAINGNAWFQIRPGQTSCTGPEALGNVIGQIDFARAARGPTSACTNGAVNCFQFIPFARNAVAYAYSGGTDPNFTTSDLLSAFSSASGVIAKNGVNWHVCISQSGSETTSFWEGAVGVTATQAAAASYASGCTSGSFGTLTSSSLEENGGNTFLGRAQAIEALGTGNEAIMDFSVGSWIAQANGASVDRSSMARSASPAIGLGQVDAAAPGAKPYTGTGSNLAPASSYYANTKYGRDLFVAIPLRSCGTACGSTGLGVAAIKSLFIGASAAICAAGPEATANKFGFAAFPVGSLTDACGDDSSGGPGGGLRGNIPEPGTTTGGAIGMAVNDVTIFGGPQTPYGPTPVVALPSGGSSTPVTATDPSETIVYGPATLFTSGTTTVSTQGTTGGGSVTSSSTIQTITDTDGGTITADALGSSCTANGTDSGSTTVTNGVVATQVDMNGNFTASQAVPTNPPQDYTVNGTLMLSATDTETYTWVFNHQAINPDGTITVTAAHYILHGPTAIGNLYFGVSTCGFGPMS